MHINKFWILPLFHESTRLIWECYKFFFHDLSKKLKIFKRKVPELNFKNFFSYLKKIGYKVEYNNSFKQKKIIKIFQMKFRPEKVDGKLDYECYEIAKSLNNLK